MEYSWGSGLLLIQTRFAQFKSWKIDSMGTVAVNLKAARGDTGTPLFAHSYQGHYTEKSMGGLEETWARVMNNALERWVRDVSTDPQFIRALKGP